MEIQTIDQIDQTELFNETSDRIMNSVLELLKPIQNRIKVSQFKRRPLIIRDKRIIKQFICSRLVTQFDTNNQPHICFRGEYFYQPELWQCETESQLHKIAHFVVEHSVTTA